MQVLKIINYLSLFLVLFLNTTNVFPQFGGKQNLVRLKPQNSEYQVTAGEEIKIIFTAAVDETWHINSDRPKEDYLIPSRLELSKDQEVKNFELKSVTYPKAKEIILDFSEESVSVFEGEFKITTSVKVPAGLSPGEYPVNFTLRYQACNNSSCLPPNSVTEQVMLIVKASDKASADTVKKSEENLAAAPDRDDSGLNPQEQVNAGSESEQVSSQESPMQSAQAANNSDSLLSKLESSGLILSLLIVFVGGLALNLTPCVYPLIPITVGYFGGQSEGSTGKLFSLGLLYVAGMAITYSIIGVVTALSGAVFGALLQNPFVLAGVALVLVTLSLSMFGVYEFKLPDRLMTMAGGAKGGYFGALLMGLTMGIVAAPCIGPFVLGLVTYVGVKGDPFYGWVMFFFLALGLGFPYILLALFSGKIKKLPRAGFWMESVKHIFGFLLLGMALYFVNPLFPDTIKEYVLPVYMILAGIYLLLFDRESNKSKGFRNFKIALSVLVIAVAVYLLIPGEKKSPDWQIYSNVVYSETLSSNQPIIIDFYADWCIPCKELDALTFSDSRVIDETKRFRSFKVDMTNSSSEESERVRNKFKIVGMPTVLVLNSRGDEVNRITGFVDANEFLNIISKID